MAHEHARVHSENAWVADALARNAPAAKNLYFNLTTIVFPGQPATRQRLIAQRMRQLGVQRRV